MVETISDTIKRISPYYKKKGEPETEHTLVYDSATETMEPLYFFTLDLMEEAGLKTEKLIDNFTSAPGSAHFSDLNQRAGILQQHSTKMLADVNTVLRSVLNLIYDLKDFKMRLEHYDGLNSKDKAVIDASTLGLKQIWMDKVDMQKGNSSIKAMALGQAGFTTLIDAFLAAKDEKDVDKLDLNDRVKRILKPRIQEFKIWLKESEKELRKRYELERSYLRSQVNSLKLYSRWAKPYLKAASQLEQTDIRGGRNADLVKTFNTILLELTLLGKKKVDIKEESLAGELPEEFARERFLKTLKRNYYVCVLVDFYFRGIPQRTGQQAQYSFGGKTEITFRAYVLNDDELKKLDQELSKSDLEDVLQLIEGATSESLGQLQEEIDYFLEEQEQEKKEKPKEVNPFLALIGRYEKGPEKVKKNLEQAKKEKQAPVKKDSWAEEKFIRPLIAKQTLEMTFKLFDVYKKAHGMPSYT